MKPSARSSSSSPLPQPKRLFAKVVRVRKISVDLRRGMYALLERYYDDVDFPRFEQDLAEKTHVFLFYDRATGDLVGFSTLYRKAMKDIAPGVFIFSGDTVLREDCWGSKILQKTFSRYIFETKMRTPHRPLYWMLMSKGFKTYMMMRMNFAHSYPNGKRSTPDRFQRVLDRFYGKKFGDAYDSRTGLIVFQRSLGAVKGGFADPDERQSAQPDVKYFLARNPRYRQGEELACVAEIRFADFLGLFPKFFLKIRKTPGRRP